MTAEGAREHLHALNQAERAAAIRRLATEGMSDRGIASATGLSVEQVRRVLAEQPGNTGVTGSFDGVPIP
jgi:DNA invertase Pin-like site-specific DNA recombinase